MRGFLLNRVQTTTRKLVGNPQCMIFNKIKQGIFSEFQGMIHVYIQGNHMEKE